MSNYDLKFWVFFLVLLFLFQGDPDVWDCFRARAGLTVEGCSTK